MTENNPAPGDHEEPKAFKAPESQNDLDQIINRAVGRVHAKYSDYEDIKAKAEKFDQAEEKDKTELQRAREASEAAVKRADEADAKALKAEIAAAKKVPAHRITGATKEELESDADRYLDEMKAAASQPAGVKFGAGLKSGSAKGGDNGVSKKEQAAAALRSMRKSQ